MRLLYAADLTFHEFEGEVPPYAIVSHTWGEEEVLYKDMLKGHARLKKGYQKIEYCARQALIDQLEYIWIDTCNIDKKSSAELSEAINSMYQWYKNAAICYTYLSDVEHSDITRSVALQEFRSSRWFTRGWTLQELLAPKKLVFYTSTWEEIGTKRSLLQEIANVTRIDEDSLLGADIKRINIAQRMSWAAGRITTRIEDEAYSLLGIFDVNMPLLYGEGVKAFGRLQEEIIKRSPDQSILAWANVPRSELGLQANTAVALVEEARKNSAGVGLLAPSKDCFAWLAHDERRSTIVPPLEIGPHVYQMTNRGLQITVDLRVVDLLNDIYAFALPTSARSLYKFYIILRCVNSDTNYFTRIVPHKVSIHRGQWPKMATRSIYAGPDQSVAAGRGIFNTPLTNLNEQREPLLVFEQSTSLNSDNSAAVLISPGELIEHSFFMPNAQLKIKIHFRTTVAGFFLANIELIPEDSARIQSVNEIRRTLSKSGKSRWSFLWPPSATDGEPVAQHIMTRIGTVLISLYPPPILQLEAKIVARRQSIGSVVHNSIDFGERDYHDFPAVVDDESIIL